MENKIKIRHISLLISVVGLLFSVYLLFKHNFDTFQIVLCLLWTTFIVNDVTYLSR